MAKRTSKKKAGRSKRPARSKKAKAPARRAKKAAPKRTASKARTRPKRAARATSRPKAKSKSKSKARPQAKPKARRAGAKRSAGPVAKGATSTKLAKFSQKILAEEEQPVAVRTFNEAREGIAASKVYTHKTGQVEDAPREKASMEDLEKYLAAKAAGGGPVVDDGAEDQGEEEIEEEAPAPRPRLTRPDREEYKVATGRGKRKGALETPDDFGSIELRQATASGGRKVTTSKAENLQRNASPKYQALTAGERSARKRSQEEFQVTERKGGPGDFADFGDVEIGQQTGSGSRKVGKLRRDRDAT